MKWSFPTGGFIQSSPAVGDENILYVTSLDGKLHAINPDGTERWNADVGDVRVGPVIAPDGTIYVAGYAEFVKSVPDGRVMAFDDDGNLKWTFKRGQTGGITGPMALSADGTLYVAIGGSGQNPGIYAINPDGTLFWSYSTGQPTAGVSVGPNGTVCFRSGGTVTLLDSLGAVLWSVVSPDAQDTTPIFAEDGTIYYLGRNLGALNFADGSSKWEVNTGGGATASPATGPNGEIYMPLNIFGTTGGIRAVDPDDGSEIWTYATESPVQTTPLVALDGTIYFGSDTNEFFAIHSDGTLKWKFATGGDILSSPTIVANGTVYFGSNDQMFYALNTDSPGPAASSWPMYQRDDRNTGQAGSDTTRFNFYAPHSFNLSSLGLGNTILTMHHKGGAEAAPAGTGTTASFRVDVRDRDGSLLFSLDESVEPGETREIDLVGTGGLDYQGSVVIDAPIKDGLSLAPFLTWILDLGFNAPLRIGAFFSDATEAAQLHYFPAEASSSNGLGIAVQNIGDSQISCTLDFLSEDGTGAGQEMILLEPLGSFVGFFNASVPEGFKGAGRFNCDAPVVAVAVNQDSSNGSFPTDRLTIKGIN